MGTTFSARRNTGKNRQKVAREEGRQGLFCVVCSKSFVPKAPRPLTCSKECSREMERRRKRVPQAPRVCVECGQQFVPSQNSRYQLSCSKEYYHKRTRTGGIRLRESERMMVPSFRERRYAMRRLRTEWAKEWRPMGSREVSSVAPREVEKRPGMESPKATEKTSAAAQEGGHASDRRCERTKVGNQRPPWYICAWTPPTKLQT